MTFPAHSLDAALPLLGFAIAAMTLFGAVAVGYGRSVRVMLALLLALLSFASLLIGLFGMLTYVNAVSERGAIEARLATLRSHVLNVASRLACIERTHDTLEETCAQTLFATPDTLAAATYYTAALYDALSTGVKYRGPRTGQFTEAIESAQRLLERDPYGFVANMLVQRGECSMQRCSLTVALSRPGRVQENIRQKTFERNVELYANTGRARDVAAAGAPAAKATPAVSLSGLTRAPIPDKYTLPSADSIPPVSIMNDERPRVDAITDQPTPVNAQRSPANAAPTRPGSPAPPKQPRRDGGKAPLPAARNPAS
jgi:hypothetical protein